MKTKNLWPAFLMLATMPLVASCDDDDDVTVNANGHEYVDLGLPSGLLWATMNVGANAPEESGDFFAWGETVPRGKEDRNNAMNYSYNDSQGEASYVKTFYDWSTYKYCNGSSTTLTKYCTDSSFGTVDGRTVLELADDAARANWGGSWRMPTLDEQQELVDNCTTEWTTQNGVNGQLLTSKKNGNTIFLPAAGLCLDSSFGGGVGSYGYFYSSSLDESNQDAAYAIGLGSTFVKPSSNRNQRAYGLPVRAVISK